MAYEKRVCVLKQIRKGFSADGSALSGAVYLERLGSSLTVTPRISLAPVREGRYALVLRIEDKTLVLALKGNESLTAGEAPTIRGGFAALLVFLRGEAEAIAFGSCGAASCGWEELLAAVRGGEKQKERKAPIPDPLPPNELPVPLAPNIPHAPTVPVPGEDENDPLRERAETYDDEAIASSDYFRPVDGHAAPHGGGQQKEEDARPHEDEGDQDLFFVPHGTLTYYHTVRARIEAAFKKYPRDDRLLSAFPHSEWVKSESALLGVVYEHGAPKYLCVAVEAGEAPPAEMEEKCCFVPSSPYRDDQGFYVVFQSADTGEYVKIEET